MAALILARGWIPHSEQRRQMVERLRAAGLTPDIIEKGPELKRSSGAITCQIHALPTGLLAAAGIPAVDLLGHPTREHEPVEVGLIQHLSRDLEVVDEPVE